MTNDYHYTLNNRQASDYVGLSARTLRSENYRPPKARGRFCTDDMDYIKSKREDIEHLKDTIRDKRADIKRLKEQKDSIKRQLKNTRAYPSYSS